MIPTANISGIMNSPRRERVLLLFLLLLGALLRVLRLVEISRHPEWLVPDQDQLDMAFFYNYGQDLAEKWRFALHLPLPGQNLLPPSPVSWTQEPGSCFVRPPAYPFFLAALFLLTNNALMAPIIAQAVLGILNALLAWRLARRAGGPGTALITAAFMLFYWVLIVYEGVYHAQTLMIFLSLLFLNALEYWSQRPSLVRAGIAGLLLTLNMFAAPSSALFAPVAACWMLAWLRLSVDSWKSALKRAFPHVFTTALCATMLVAPVTLSNWRADHQFTLVSTGGGMMLAFGNHDGADGYFRPFDIKELGVNVDSNNYDEVCAVFEQVKGIKPIPAVVNRYCARYALEWIRQHPERFLALTLKRAVIYWQPKEISHNVQEYCLKKMSRFLRWLPGGFPEILGALGVAAVMGLWSFRRADPLTRLRWMLPFLYSLVFYLPFTVFYFAGHYRVPILPFLAMMGAGGVCAALAHLRPRPMLAITALSCGLVLWVSTRMIPVDYKEDWERWFWYKPEAVRRLVGESSLNDFEARVDTRDILQSSSGCLFMAGRASARKDFPAVINWCHRGLDLNNLTMEQKIQFLSMLSDALVSTNANDRDIETIYRELLRYAPTHFAARFFLANLSLKARDYPDALIHLLAAVEANPNNGNAWFLLGNCQMAMGFPQQAEEAYRKGMENDPADPWPAMGLAGVLETQGHLDEARQAVEEALRRDPSIQAARDMLNRLNRGMERP